ncbi:hypothetical protein AcV5_003384 [Taiwanofungus camphoratus]|nr:hypothetical protein AcV5_003384 [Antrodia cinnamomea]
MPYPAVFSRRSTLCVPASDNAPRLGPAHAPAPVAQIPHGPILRAPRPIAPPNPVSPPSPPCGRTDGGARWWPPSSIAPTISGTVATTWCPAFPDAFPGFPEPKRVSAHSLALPTAPSEDVHPSIVLSVRRGALPAYRHHLYCSVPIPRRRVAPRAMTSSLRLPQKAVQAPFIRRTALPVEPAARPNIRGSAVSHMRTHRCGLHASSRLQSTQRPTQPVGRARVRRTLDDGEYQTRPGVPSDENAPLCLRRRSVHPSCVLLALRALQIAPGSLPLSSNAPRLPACVRHRYRCILHSPDPRCPRLRICTRICTQLCIPPPPHPPPTSPSPQRAGARTIAAPRSRPHASLSALTPLLFLTRARGPSRSRRSRGEAAVRHSLHSAGSHATAAATTLSAEPAHAAPAEQSSGGAPRLAADARPTAADVRPRCACARSCDAICAAAAAIRTGAPAASPSPSRSAQPF